MDARRRAIATAIAIATALSPTGVAWAADSDEVKDLKREVSQLRSEVQALQVVLAETTELERQRSANLTRALRDSAAPPAAAPAAGSEGVPAAAATPAPASVAAPDKGRSASHHRKHRHPRHPRSKDR
jgi:hypothetical protein